jgi:hypothetical protein
MQWIYCDLSACYKAFIDITEKKETMGCEIDGKIFLESTHQSVCWAWILFIR